MTQPDTSTGQIKTTAIRFTPERHAAITLIARLRKTSLQDEAIKAIDAHVAAAKTDPDLLKLVDQEQAAIEAEAQEQRATLATLFTAKSTPPAKATAARAGAKS